MPEPAYYAQAVDNSGFLKDLVAGLLASPDKWGQAANGLAVLLVLGALCAFAILVRQNFWEHWTTRIAFRLWLAHWLSYALAYLFLYVRAPAGVLLAADVGSLCSLCFALTFTNSDDATQEVHEKKIGKVLWYLSGALIVLVIFAILYYVAVQEDLPAIWKLIAIAPSELLANIGVIAVAWAFLCRYRSFTAGLLLFLSLFYAFAQMSAYGASFLLEPLAKDVGRAANSLGPQLLPARADLQRIAGSLHSPIWIFFWFLAPMKLILASLCLALLYTPFWYRSRFSVDAKTVDALEDRTMPVSLRHRFEEHGIALSDHAVVDVIAKGSRWQVTDQDRKYAVEKVKTRMEVYEDRPILLERWPTGPAVHLDPKAERVLKYVLQGIAAVAGGVITAFFVALFGFK